MDEQLTITGLTPLQQVDPTGHRVAAHSRMLPDGTEVFVQEHLRWNRGRRPQRPRTPRRTPPAPDQPSLFDAQDVLER